MIVTNYVHSCSRCGHTWTAEIPLPPLGQLQKPVIESELHCRACGDGKWETTSYTMEGMTNILNRGKL